MLIAHVRFWEGHAVVSLIPKEGDSMSTLRKIPTGRRCGSTDPVDLREREKELDFVYSLATLLSGTDLDECRVAGQTAGLFRNALTRPELVQVQVGINGFSARSPAGPWASLEGKPGNTLRVSSGQIETCWLEARYPDYSISFSDRERALGESVARLLAISARRMVSDRNDSALNLDLERKNAALSELLSRIELEKQNIRDSIASRLMDRVYPLLARMDRDGLPVEWAADIRRALENSVAGTSGGNLALRSLLSSRELEICALVADGLSSKEIAYRLGLAAATVERHRHNARRKLGLPARQGSLGSLQLKTDL